MFIEFLSWQMSCIVIDGGGSFIMSTRGFSAMRHAPVVGIDSSCIWPIRVFTFSEMGLFLNMTNSCVMVIYIAFQLGVYLEMDTNVLNNITFAHVKKYNEIYV